MRSSQSPVKTFRIAWCARLAAWPRETLLVLVLGTTSFGLSAPASAALIPYRFTITAQHIYEDYGGGAQSGQTYEGRLLVDDSILATDGPANAGRPVDFWLQIGPGIWDQNFPVNEPPHGSEFLGFRGPCYNPDLHCTAEQGAIWGLGSEFLGFEVLNGTIVGLWGGIFGQTDAPFVDFNGTSVWVAVRSLMTTGLPRDYADFSGAIYVAPVAEPQGTALLMLGLVSGAFLVLRRKRFAPKP